MLFSCVFATVGDVGKSFKFNFIRDFMDKNYEFDTRTGNFTLARDWQERLKMYGSYNTYLDGLAYNRCASFLL